MKGGGRSVVGQGCTSYEAHAGFRVLCGALVPWVVAERWRCGVSAALQHAQKHGRIGKRSAGRQRMLLVSVDECLHTCRSLVIVASMVIA